jgi:hypothetical protein
VFKVVMPDNVVTLVGEVDKVEPPINRTFVK